jgi:hypothetical protein
MRQMKMKIKKLYAESQAMEDMKAQMEEVNRLCDGDAYPPTCIRALLKLMAMFMEYVALKE